MKIPDSNRSYSFITSGQGTLAFKLAQAAQGRLGALCPRVVGQLTYLTGG